MSLDDQTITEICPHALFRKHRRGETALCLETRGKDAPNSLGYIAIANGEVCIATEFYSTGHVDLDSYILKDEMEKCPYNPNRKD